MERTYWVRVFDAGPGRLVRLSAVADCMQDIAAAHAEVLGFSGGRFFSLGLAWVLARMRLVIHRPPESGSRILVRTWPSDVSRAVARRDYELEDEAGRVLGAATQAWVALDLDTRRLARMPEFVHFGHGAEIRPRPLDFEGKNPPRLQEPVRETVILARRADADENGHVNNARLLDWLSEPLPEAVCRTRPCLEVDVAFKHECLAGDEVRSLTDEGPDGHPDGDGRVIHSLIRSSDGMELVRAATRWGPVPAD